MAVAIRFLKIPSVIDFNAGVACAGGNLRVGRELELDIVVSFNVIDGLGLKLDCRSTATTCRSSYFKIHMIEN